MKNNNGIGRFASLIGIAIVFLLIFSYNMSFKRIKLECINGNCRVLDGEKVLEAFAYDDVRACYPSVFRRYCRNRFSDLTQGRKCYYPELVMKDGRSLYLHYKFDSRYKHEINAFCNNFKLNKDFIYK